MLKAERSFTSPCFLLRAAAQRCFCRRLIAASALLSPNLSHHDCPALGTFPFGDLFAVDGAQLILLHRSATGIDTAGKVGCSGLAVLHVAPCLIAARPEFDGLGLVGQEALSACRAGLLEAHSCSSLRPASDISRASSSPSISSIGRFFANSRACTVKPEVVINTPFTAFRSATNAP